MPGSDPPRQVVTIHQKLAERKKMTNTKNSIFELHSEWVNGSLIRTITRQVGKKNKILVDVIEVSEKSTSKQRALNAAIAAARRVGCVSVDCTKISDNEIVRNSFDLHTDRPVKTKVRSITFAFSGVE